MPPDRKNLYFYFDESLLGVGKAITIARRDSIHVGHPLIEADFPLGIVDSDWLPKVAAVDWVVFLRDRRIRTKPAELLAFREHRVRAFWLAGKKNLSVWGTLVRLVNHWPRIERIVLSRGPGPWFMAINEDEIVEIPVAAEKGARSDTTSDQL
jgi:hypothetical protein